MLQTEFLSCVRALSNSYDGNAASPSGMDDRQLLGMQWEWQMYIDASLPFGLLSAPIIFSAVVDALEWILT